MSPASWAETRQISVRIPVRRVLRPSRAGRGLPFPADAAPCAPRAVLSNYERSFSYETQSNPFRPDSD